MITPKPSTKLSIQLEDHGVDRNMRGRSLTSPRQSHLTESNCSRNRVSELEFDLLSICGSLCEQAR
ncbi:hypothetical protein KC19_2G217400 [Ceratodon purpureus]|uniref:Uncharacterized protein n=1 Tax=Ceratodon purpureus TaxID=3225 RepID=A0A8T0IWM8_CERPU|nr:hypothetical protein KC19_2G217400 [Ceratodon purpureus]